MRNASAAILSMLQQRDGSADWNRWQIHRKPFWDYARLAVAGTSSISFFQNALGSLDPVSSTRKTMEQTNMAKTGTFGQVYFFLEQIRVHLHPLAKNRQASAIADDADLFSTTWGDAASALAQILRAGVLRFSIGQKEYFDIERPFQTCPPGFGVDIIQNASARTTQVAVVQQSADMDDCYRIEPVQMIEPEQTFDVRIDFPGGNSPSLASLVSGADLAVDIGIILDGYEVRPAQ